MLHRHTGLGWGTFSWIFMSMQQHKVSMGEVLGSFPSLNRTWGNAVGLMAMGDLCPHLFAVPTFLFLEVFWDHPKAQHKSSSSWKWLLRLEVAAEQNKLIWLCFHTICLYPNSHIKAAWAMQVGLFLRNKVFLRLIWDTRRWGRWTMKISKPSCSDIKSEACWLTHRCISQPHSEDLV